MSARFGNLGWETVVQELAKMAAREVARRLFNRIFDRVRLHHVVGALAIALGQAGLFFYSAVLYAWCWLVAPVNMGIALHSSFYVGAPLVLTAVWVIGVFSMGVLGSVVLVGNGINWFDYDSDLAKLFRRIPLLRWLIRKRKDRPVLSKRPPYIVLK